MEAAGVKHALTSCPPLPQTPQRGAGRKQRTKNDASEGSQHTALKRAAIHKWAVINDINHQRVVHGLCGVEARGRERGRERWRDRERSREKEKEKGAAITRSETAAPSL